MSPLARLFALVLFSVLASCGGSSGGGGDGGVTPGGTVVVDLETVSGFIRRAIASGSIPIEGVKVSIASSQGTHSARTDFSGAFIIPSAGTLPVGSLRLIIDGSTTEPTGALDFPRIEVVLPLVAGVKDFVLPRVIVLPDLNDPDSANQNVTMENGFSYDPINVNQDGGQIEIELNGPAGTEIRSPDLDGTEFELDLNLTTVRAENVAQPIPAGLHATEFLTIQPENLTFIPFGTSLGLDLTLPNDLGLALGTEVDIWCFDSTIGEWVNRSEETGNRGEVVEQFLPEPSFVGVGTRIEVSDIVTKSGLYAAVLPVDEFCSTTIRGSVLDDPTAGLLGSSQTGVEGVTIALSTGQFAVTDSEGDYSIELVPAYNSGDLITDGLCDAQSLELTAFFPPHLGGTTVGPDIINAGVVVTGGTTTVDPIVVTLPVSGSVAGVVIGNFDPEDLITFELPSVDFAQTTPNDRDSFFVSDLAPGDWTATFQFTGDAQPTVAPFTVVAGQITTIILQSARGSGSDAITVRVLMDDDDNDFTDLVPSSGSQVMLVGTDAVSANGLKMITNINGEAVFQDVTGPFTVTAQTDVPTGKGLIRLASSLVDIEPVNQTIVMPFFSLRPFLSIGFDAVVSGTITNLPDPDATQFIVVGARESGTDGDFFDEETIILATGDGTYSIPIPPGLDVDLSFTQIGANLGNPIRASLVVPNAGQASIGSDLVVDVDFDNAVDWTDSVTINTIGLDPSELVDFDFVLSNQAGSEFPFELAVEATPGSISFKLPQLPSPALPGFEASVQASANDPFAFGSFPERECTSFFTATPISIDMQFEALPTFTNPVDNQLATVSQLETFNVMFNENGNTGSNSNGLNFCHILTADSIAPAGVSFVAWSTILPSGVNSFVMPKSALPMFVDGATVRFEVNKFRLVGNPVDYSALFSEDFQAEFDKLTKDQTAECESSSGVNVRVQ